MRKEFNRIILKLLDLGEKFAKLDNLKEEAHQIHFSTIPIFGSE